jgi:dihydroxyacetone kinase
LAVAEASFLAVADAFFEDGDGAEADLGETAAPEADLVAVEAVLPVRPSEEAVEPRSFGDSVVVPSVALAAVFRLRVLTAAVDVARELVAAAPRLGASSTVTSIPWSPIARMTAFQRRFGTPAVSSASPTA